MADLRMGMSASIAPMGREATRPIRLGPGGPLRTSRGRMMSPRQGLVWQSFLYRRVAATAT